MTEHRQAQIKRFQDSFTALQATLPKLPDNVQAPKILKAAVAADLAPPTSETTVLNAWHQLRYDRNPPGDETLENALTRMEELIAQLSQLLPIQKDQLTAVLSPPAQKKPVAKSPPVFLEPMPSPTADAEKQPPPQPVVDETADPSPKPRPPRLGRINVHLPRVLFFGLIWSCGMLVLGVIYHRPLYERGAIYYHKALGLDWDTEAAMIRARGQAVRSPDDPFLWRDLANRYVQLNQYAEATAAFERALSLNPRDAETLNSYAWMLCTADDSYYRDPIRALRLSREAYALNPSAHITDTLAEAAFQNGLFKEARDLGEEALNKTQGNHDYYRRQLEKFRKAVENQQDQRSDQAT